MKKDRLRACESAPAQNRPSTAYIYLVKNPSSNEISVCAWDSVLYPGTSVVSPTRYGLDLGVVVASADKIGREYEKGNDQIQGACLHGGCCSPADDEDLVAIGDLDEQGEVILTGDNSPVWSEEPDEDPCSSCPGCSAHPPVDMVSLNGDTVWIDRLATPSDLTRYQEFSTKEDEAMRVCREKISMHKLDMKLVTAHFLLGEPKIIFFFTADVRVDFRELVKDLVSVFRIRIELRQIGVRDESRVLGGLAVCGRDYCCHSVTDKLNPVSIKMAKEQNLSLNSMKISGPCGRLLCCLSYEFDFYVEEKQKYPAEGSRLKVGYDLMKVTEVNILSKKISLSGSEGRMLSIPCEAVFFSEENSRWEITDEYASEFLSN
ncbi:putative PSP1-like protein [Sphaerochaeta pleomorpha str. Grapes]|uniref:Putative PSP1-like protein n=1 Tax=Sphaerochaeta pleomorpha (strain ATCC BAA-1885 / DSM 22778 / Grapes) TaxID=158190 RepID=G8QRW3_SPHPG|nr:regulatory iron-sulfur-containing complex subunit RicT [Sphaerochaeta pleomorpha]AEV29961.1 putative PSP1-like protein [Sphaerochaeta pleomorpha str. Grapes]